MNPVVTLKLLLKRETDLVTATVAVANGIDAVAVADQAIDARNRAEAQAGADAEDIGPIRRFGRHRLYHRPIAVEMSGHVVLFCELLPQFEIGDAEIVRKKL